MAQNDNPPIQTAVPDHSLKRLEILVGRWDLTGRTLDSEDDNITGWNIFEWLPGGFFLKSSGEIIFKGFKVQSLEIIGYDPQNQTFPSLVYSNMSGSVAQYHWNVQDNIVTHWDVSSKYRGTLSADGKTLSGGWRPNESQESPENEGYDAGELGIELTVC